MTGPFHVVDERPGPQRWSVYEHGWQSWSPSGLYPATATSPRPRRTRWHTMAFRPGRPPPPTGFQGEGLLAVVDADGGATLWASPQPTETVASIRAAVVGDRLVVSADGPVVRTEASGGTGLATALESWANKHGRGDLRSLGAGWCSWYCLWDKVTADDVTATIAAIERLALPIDVVQIDDGWQAGIGDWTTTSPRFGSLADTARRIVDGGHHAGIWTAPLLVGAGSRFATDHPRLLVAGAVAAEHHWDQRVGVLDVTHPDGAAHLERVFTGLRDLGFTYFKCDFLYAGAMTGGRAAATDPVAAYRHALGIIRDAIGADSVLLGCGAPLLASIGLVDAMRISPDVSPSWEPTDGDVSQPGMRSAFNAERARRFMHGRLWINDPDCLIARDEVTARDRWAAHVAAGGGLVVASDVLDAVDGHGLDLLRAGLRAARPEPVEWVPAAPEGDW